MKSTLAAGILLGMAMKAQAAIVDEKLKETMNTPTDSTAERTPGSLHPAGSAATPATAYRDATGWVLFDALGNVIEDWPEGWPQTVDSAFLTMKGVRPVR